MEMDYQKILNDCREVITDSITQIQKDHRLKIFNRLVIYIEESGSFSELHAKLLHDFDCFCAFHVRLDDGRPMFPAVWQSKAAEICEKYEESWILNNRKSGKSAFGSAFCLFSGCGHENLRTIVFAPTTDQLFIMEDIWKATGRSEFFMAEYVKVQAPLGQRGTYGKEHIIFGGNKSEFVSSNLAQNLKSDSKRGQKGGRFIVDEIGLVEKETRDTVIDPMMADAYTKKKMVYTGTPKLIANPELEEEWEVAKKDPLTGTIHVDIWDSLEQGCVTRRYVKKRFEKLKINCEWGLVHGICGKRFRNAKCNEACKLNDTFVMEDLAEFPVATGRFYPKAFLNACTPLGDYPWEDSGIPNKVYIMSIDYGLLTDPTQLMIWEVTGGDSRLVYWEELAPVPNPDKMAEYTEILNAIRDKYYDFVPMAIYADATNVGFELNAQLTKPDDSGRPGIPKSKFYSNETSVKKGVLGVWMSGPYDHTMFQNHKDVLISVPNRITVPRKNPFWTKFFMEHFGINNTRAANKQYLKFKEPPGGSMDMLVACALASLHFSVKPKKAFMHASRSGRRKMGPKPPNIRKP